ncbi:MAG TPA: universal stress protein, partial [Thermoanaerobaculia bacterium]|nr:universal stress protein [Thermoanaerobaculia bacterium]
RAFAKRAAKARAAVATKVVIGDRVERILQFAAANDVGLIVLSSHKVDARRPGKGLDTISYKVAILAACPVMLVK